MKKFRLTNKTFHFYSPLLRFINWSANFVYRCSLQSKSPFLLFLRFNHAAKRVLNVQFVCISCLTQYCALLKTMKYFLSKTRTICYSKITGSKQSIAFTTYFTTTRSLNKLFRNALFNFGGETLRRINEARRTKLEGVLLNSSRFSETKIMLDCNRTTKSLYYYYLTTGAVATTKGLKVFGNFVYSCASTTKKITCVC